MATSAERQAAYRARKRRQDEANSTALRQLVAVLREARQTDVRRKDGSALTVNELLADVRTEDRDAPQVAADLADALRRGIARLPLE